MDAEVITSAVDGLGVLWIVAFLVWVALIAYLVDWAASPDLVLEERPRRAPWTPAYDPDFPRET